MGAPGARAATGDGLLSILAMGDSYTAGNGGGSYYGPKHCWRSPYNYARRFRRLVEAPPYRQTAFVRTVACSGDVTSSITSGRNGRPPQHDAVNARYDLIFLTIGGNDLSFADIVKYCLVAKRRDGAYCGPLLSNAERLVRDGTMEKRVATVLKDIKKRASADAKIVLLGYPYLEGDENYALRSGHGGHTFIQVGKRLRALARAGDAAQHAAVRTASGGGQQIMFVKTKALFAGPPTHELFAQRNNSRRWFVQPFIDSTLASFSTWYHPNPRGWLEEAKLLVAQPRIRKRDPMDNRDRQCGGHPPPAGKTMLVSRNQEDSQTLVEVSISANGCYVVFSSTGSGLSSTPSPAGQYQVFERNLQTGVTRMVSVNRQGTAGADSHSSGEDGYGSRTVSADGRYVVFGSYADDLTSEPRNGYYQLYRRDMQTGVTRMVSVNNHGTGGASASSGTTAVAISGNGRYVAFDSKASDLVSERTGGHEQVFERDMKTGVTRIVSRNEAATAGANGDSANSGVAVSDNGRHVVFGSEGSDLNSVPTNGVSQVYDRDMTDGTTRTVSMNKYGTGGANSGSATHGLAISGDGTHVVFASYASDLTSEPTTNDQIFERNMTTGVTRLVSINRDGTGGDGYHHDNVSPSTSRDGRYVVFLTGAPDVTSYLTTGFQVFERDMKAGRTALVSVNRDGTRASNMGETGVGVANVSGNGQFVAFASMATDLTPDPASGNIQVYVRNMGWTP